MPPPRQVELPPPRPIFTPDGEPLMDPFPWLCKLLGLLGQISDTVNAFPTAATLSGDPTLYEALVPFRQVSSATFTSTACVLIHSQAVTDFHLALPTELHFNIHNFQAYASAQYSQVTFGEP